MKFALRIFSKESYADSTGAMNNKSKENDDAIIAESMEETLQCIEMFSSSIQHLMTWLEVHLHIWNPET